MLRDKAHSDTGISNEASETLNREEADLLWYEKEHESVLLDADEYAQWASISAHNNDAPPKEKKRTRETQTGRDYLDRQRVNKKARRQKKRQADAQKRDGFVKGVTPAVPAFDSADESGGTRRQPPTPP